MLSREGFGIFVFLLRRADGNSKITLKRNPMKLIKLVFLAITLSFSALAFAAQVNINTVDAKTLAAAANGIGPVKAKAVVQYRKAHGSFSSLQELTKVKGIGPKTVEGNKDVLTVGSDSAASK
jgi:competence protein ComEA